MANHAAPRADPDALLAIAAKEGRGRLKVFLGASPGVGKTFSMLTAAREAKAAGRDVAVGLVETHGRRETEALLADFEILPRRSIAYRNRWVPEFDLDAALARRPSLILVDEFAHTNVPGSRHPKRWHDVRELLDAGIDVWTTLNVQHLESLNDVVLKITGVRVRETVPDTVFETADEVVLVDLPPGELLKRMAEGKVYVQDTAAQAVQRFFTPQNLTALRELALRRVAEQVDDALVERMQAGAIEGPWAAGERIMALVGPDAVSRIVVRQSKRLADLMNAPWTAISVERPGHALDGAAAKQLAATLRLAGDLGADTETLVGGDIPGEALRYARHNNVTQIVVGRSRAGWWGELVRRSLPQELVRSAVGIGVHVVTTDAGQATRGRSRWPKPGRPRLLAYLFSSVMVALAIAVGGELKSLTVVPNLSMVFITAVLGSAALFGMWPAIYTSVLSFLAYDFFFVEPVHTFSIDNAHEFLALAIFLIVGLATSALAGRVRDQAQDAVGRMRATRRLYEFTRKLSTLASREDVAEGAASMISTALSRPATVLLSDGVALQVTASWPPLDELDAASLTAARWAHEHTEPAGADTGTLPLVPWLFLPLRTPRAKVGAVGIAQTPGGAPLDNESRALLDVMAEQTAAAIERAALAGEMGAVKEAAATERVRNTLLASIGHDFRTPLASILGAATSLQEYGDKLAPATRVDLLGQIRDEAESLDRMVRDLLAITRLESGGLEVRRDWVDLGDIVQRAATAARRRFAGRRIEVEAGAIDLAFGDATLLEQAIGNLIENALVHGGPEAVVRIVLGQDDATLTVAVIDDGRGIATEVLPRIFDKFYSGRAADRNAGQWDGSHGGVGLGLAIAKGVIEAQGGEISAISPVANNHGAQFVLSLPRRTRMEAAIA
jgi:two-component system, OmpR family, sensor histidine kinase KdpD